jgi:hypothetical protein
MKDCGSGSGFPPKVGWALPTSPVEFSEGNPIQQGQKKGPVLSVGTAHRKK